MLEAERQLTIINLLKRKVGVKISDLSSMCQVSQNTIRRDLEKLEKDGVLRRTRGGAILSTSRGIELPADVREGRDYEEKQRIGAAAASLVEDNETIIADAGTTTLQVVRAIEGKKGITVITNSLLIGNNLSERTDIVGIVTGGIIRHVNDALVGFPVEAFLTHQIHEVDKLFLGVGGIDAQSGFTITTPFEVELKRAMIRSARQVIVVAASSKLGKTALFNVCPLDAVHVLITGNEASSATLQEIRDIGKFQIITA